MVYLSIALLLTPFAAGGAIASSDRARTFVARHYRLCSTIGWTAAALLAPTAVLLDGTQRSMVLMVLCPVTALGFWRRTDDGGGDSDDPDPPGPDGPAIDWEQFRRDFDAHVMQRSRRMDRAGSLR